MYTHTNVHIAIHIHALKINLSQDHCPLLSSTENFNHFSSFVPTGEGARLQARGLQPDLIFKEHGIHATPIKDLL